MMKRESVNLESQLAARLAENTALKAKNIELTGNLSATTLSINNVSDALGLSDDGAFSLEVITKFTDLQKDNETLRAMVQELTAQRDSMAPGDTEAANMRNAKIYPIPIKRDRCGYWSHPDYCAYFDGRESIPEDEYNEWLERIGMECFFTYLEDEDGIPALHRYFELGDADIHDWEPSPPDGQGWFIVSIHDTEDGPACIWMREAK